MQTSLRVQASLSVHRPALGWALQMPLLHVPLAHAPSLAVQSIGAPLHTPPWHLSPVVHKSLSSQGNPFCSTKAVVLCRGLHTWHGLAGLTVPALMHWPLMLQSP